jgi:hypothetical protein
MLTIPTMSGHPAGSSGPPAVPVVMIVPVGLEAACGD